MTDFRIGSRGVGGAAPVFIIAELGVNHGGDPDLALKMVETAASLGADAVKVQTVDPDESYIPGERSHEIYRKARLAETDLESLLQAAKRCHVEIFSTAGDLPSLRLLLQLGMPAVKISSGLMTNAPLIEEAAASGLPLIVSTGMAYLDEVSATVRRAEQAGATRLALLHCTSLYPAPPETLNLAAITTLRETFPHPVGYSDHSDGATACVAAVALGARILEKHFTLDKNLPGPEHRFSADPGEFGKLVQQVRLAERMLGSPHKAPVDAELPYRETLRRCLVARRNIEKGTALGEEHIGLKRPRAGNRGLPPEYYHQILGRRTAREVRANQPITMDVLLQAESV